MQCYETCNDKWRGDLHRGFIHEHNLASHFLAPLSHNSLQLSELGALGSWLACIDPLFGNKVPTQL